MTSKEPEYNSQPPLHVDVDTRLEVLVTRAGSIAFSVALARGLSRSETLRATSQQGGNLPIREVLLDHGTRVHMVNAPEGPLSIEYTATARADPVSPQPVTDEQRLVYLRPSRYCKSDAVVGLASSEFGSGVDDAQKVFHVTRWVHERVAYRSGSTDASDDALHPLLMGEGVCRDFAHLGITLCRALGIPARYVSVYAPGLDPMEAHAVFEAEIEGVWRVFDATRLAPRASMIRIGTGRDAADVALLATATATTGALEMDLTVVASPGLPIESHSALSSLA
jgi:transglutaminase-like putative cysteine protease